MKALRGHNAEVSLELLSVVETVCQNRDLTCSLLMIKKTGCFMKTSLPWIYLSLFLSATSLGYAQEISFFFSAGDFSGEPDRFGNTHTVGPGEAIEPRPFGNEALDDVFFDEDNLWLIYVHEGNTFLVSHAPGDFEDSPEVYMDITVAIGGTYEVILDHLDNRSEPGSGPIQAALGDNDLVEYSELNSTPATGGTAPGYPSIGNVTSGNMWWQTVSLGEVEVEAGEVIRVRVDDVAGFAEDFVTSTWNGVTLRVIELSGSILEVQVSPGAFDWVTDVSGNQFRTGPVDTAAFPTQADWLTVNANSSSDNFWNIREGLGSYGPILESFPNAGEDAPPLQTSVILANGGTYDVFFSLGDVGAVDAEENLVNQTPLNFAFEGSDFTRWHANDGEFKGTPGYNDYEMAVGEITVADGEQVNFLIDDVQDGTASRSVYLGMRLVARPSLQISEFQVSPGVFESTTDLFGNTFHTGPADAASFPAQEDWLTVNANSSSDNLWNIREGLGSYGPIIESFPAAGEDAPTLQTSVTFATPGVYDVFFSLGDIGAVDAEENLVNQTPLNFAFDGEGFTRWHANDGTFNGTPGYNDYEMSVGQVRVATDETLRFLIDDVQDGTAARSVYLGMRFVYVGPGMTEPVDPPVVPPVLPPIVLPPVPGQQPGSISGIDRAADGIISIEFTGVLQSSDSLGGEYQPVANATSPFTVDASGDAKFYIAR